MTELVELVIEDELWSSLDLATLAERAARLALAVAGGSTQGYEISIMACNDARISELNAEYRGKTGPTNVLSWPSFDLAPETDGNQPGLPPEPQGIWAQALGDLAISFETCQREAAESGIPLADHVTHLVLHGCLHLLGYDHVRDGDARLMERLESSALASLGIADPYSGHEHQANQAGQEI